MQDISLKDRLKFTGIGLVVVGIIVICVLEFKWFQNTLAVKQLVAIFAVIGAIFGVVVGHFFAQNTNDSVEKMRWYLIFLTLGGLLLPVFGSMTNRLLSFSNYKNQPVELFEQKGFIADVGIIQGQSLKPDGYFTFVILDGNLERLKSKEILYPNAVKGDLVDLKMKKGLYGFWVIKTD